MQFSKLLAAATLFVSGALAADYACGSNTYSSSEVSAAQDAGYKLYQEGSDADDYPHQYNDYEGFDFPVSGDWYEFPILSSGDVYDGGSPGADRVIFNEQGQLAGLITHTGASGNDFVSCDGDDF